MVFSPTWALFKKSTKRNRLNTRIEQKWKFRKRGEIALMIDYS